MAVATREALKQYALRALGAPVLEINVDEDQLEDRLDEAIDYWRLYHYDGIEKVYLKQIIRASEMTLTAAVTANFIVEERIVGATSGAKATVTRETSRQSSGTMLLVKNVEGTFVGGETITGQTGGLTATLNSTTPITLREYDKRYLEISELVYGITRVLPFTDASSSKNIFDLQYQLRLNDLYDLTSTSLIYYKTVMSHLALLDLELNGHQIYRFNRMQGKLFLDINWAADIALGDFIVVECYRALDPAEYSRVWSEPWLKHYVTALFKRQWGINLKKFAGLTLPGGVTLDGQTLFDEAKTEIEDLEQELMNKSAPLDFFMG
jgi:hypothetical protein